MIGTVIQITGPVSYMVRLKDYTIHRRHQDQLRIFRGSEDTDVSLADVPSVENSTGVTSQRLKEFTSQSWNCQFPQCSRTL